MDGMVAARTPLGSTQPVEELARDTALQQAFGVLGVGVGIAVEDGRLIDANDALLELLGLDRAAVLGSTLTELLGGLGAGDLSLRRSGGSTEHSFTRGDGRRTWARVTVTDVRGRDDRVLLAVHAVEDITDQKALEAGLRERALLDPVTGLPNRYLLEDRLEHALAQRRRGGHELAVLFVDLDGFKVVNDTAGHRVGDAVLQEAGRRITASARGADTVARWAGDEFVVLCEGVTDPRDAERIAERITAACAEPFGVAGQVFALGASVGLSMTGPPPSVDADTLLDLADQAMYAHKSARRRTGDLDTP
jgi:diguanylate cyclase (GGDEF)-like protein/PAS domain S-box-containing protein